MNEIEKRELIDSVINFHIASNGKSDEEIENELREAFNEMEDMEDINVDEIIQEIKSRLLNKS